jgi:hypothetical protein
MGPVRFSADKFFGDSEGKIIHTVTGVGMLRIVTIEGSIDWPIPIEARIGYQPAEDV